jgi:hypothetical protein
LLFYSLVADVFVFNSQYNTTFSIIGINLFIILQFGG